MAEVRSIFLLTAAEIRQHARQQAESGEACSHGYPARSPGAICWERAYVERRIELDDHQAAA